MCSTVCSQARNASHHERTTEVMRHVCVALHDSGRYTITLRKVVHSSNPLVLFLMVVLESLCLSSDTRSSTHQWALCELQYAVAFGTFIAAVVASASFTVSCLVSVPSSRCFRPSFLWLQKSSSTVLLLPLLARLRAQRQRHFAWKVALSRTGRRRTLWGRVWLHSRAPAI